AASRGPFVHKLACRYRGKASAVDRRTLVSRKLHSALRERCSASRLSQLPHRPRKNHISSPLSMALDCSEPLICMPITSKLLLDCSKCCARCRNWMVSALMTMLVLAYTPYVSDVSIYWQLLRMYYGYRVWLRYATT